MRRLAVVGAVGMLWLVLPSASNAAGVETCGGLAPYVTGCSTGTHTSMGHWARQDVVAYAYVGTVVSRLDWTAGGRSGTRLQKCIFRGDRLTDLLGVDCSGEGGWPERGVPVVWEHSCSSYAPASRQPGGAGNWRCVFSFV